MAHRTRLVNVEGALARVLEGGKCRKEHAGVDEEDAEARGGPVESRKPGGGNEPEAIDVRDAQEHEGEGCLGGPVVDDAEGEDVLLHSRAGERIDLDLQRRGVSSLQGSDVGDGCGTVGTQDEGAQTIGPTWGVVHVLKGASLYYPGWKNIIVKIPTWIEQHSKLRSGPANMTFVGFRVRAAAEEYVDDFTVFFDELKYTTNSLSNIYDGYELRHADFGDQESGDSDEVKDGE